MLIIEKLKKQDNMSESEILISDFILSRGSAIKDYTTRSLAVDTFTSPATIVRLCQKLSFIGFNDFKNQFLIEIDYLDRQFGKIDANFPFQENDPVMKVANKMSQLFIDTVEDSLSLIEEEKLVLACDLISKANSVHIFSVGTTLNLAESFQERMLKIGKNVDLESNLNYQLYKAYNIPKDDVAIIISYSGETGSIIKIAEQCKKREIPIIAITSFGENTLSKFSLCRLLVSTKENLNNNLGDFSSHISIHYILDVLYSTYFSMNYNENYEFKVETSQILEKNRTSTNAIIKNSESDI